MNAEKQTIIHDDPRIALDEREVQEVTRRTEETGRRVNSDLGTIALGRDTRKHPADLEPQPYDTLKAYHIGDLSAVGAQKPVDQPVSSEPPLTPAREPMIVPQLEDDEPSPEAIEQARIAAEAAEAEARAAEEAVIAKQKVLDALNEALKLRDRTAELSAGYSHRQHVS